jgi:diphthine synthase
MLYIIGLGLNDERDITLKGVDAMRKCDEIYAEFYTNVWHGSIETLEELSGKSIIVLDREKAESGFIVERAKECLVALLVPGDPFSATTHYETFAECKRLNIRAEAVHPSSIFTAVAESGIDIYKFGRATTLVHPQKGYNPESLYCIIKENKDRGLHTLVLLDIGMTASEAVGLMLKYAALTEDEMIVACFSLGSKAQKIIYDTAANIIQRNIADVPCCILVLGRLNFKEEEFLKLWKT